MKFASVKCKNKIRNILYKFFGSFDIVNEKIF